MCLEKSYIFRTEKFVVSFFPDREDVSDVWLDAWILHDNIDIEEYDQWSVMKSWNNKIIGVENSEVRNEGIFYLTAFEKREIPFCNLHDYVYLSSVTSQAIQ